jgi:hypothetical protein
MVVSEITHCTGVPSGYFRVEISLAADLAMSMVDCSRLSLTPPQRPSMVGLMPILG